MMRNGKSCCNQNVITEATYNHNGRTDKPFGFRLKRNYQNDVTMIQSYLAELTTLEGIYLHAADANQDGIVDISDATAIQMYIAEYELPYPIGQYFTKEVVTQENN